MDHEQIIRCLRSERNGDVQNAIAEIVDQYARGGMPQSIREALVALAKRTPSHPSAGSAIWALGKCRDPELKPVFDNFLVEAVERLRLSGSDVWQAIVALSDCGVQSMRISGGSLKFDASYERARQYLIEEHEDEWPKS